MAKKDLHVMGEVQVFTIFLVAPTPPIRLATKTDMLQQWLDQLRGASKDAPWLPIEFRDEEGTVVLAFHPQHIVGVVRAEPVKEEKQG